MSPGEAVSETVRPAAAVTLSVRYAGLSHIPTPELDAARMRSVDLSGNRFVGVPDPIRTMRALEDLFLDDNQLDSLPSWLPELSDLRHFTWTATG
jgi:Leucine-rich repeat (LRR) protein